MTARVIPDNVRRAQVEASDTGVSAWVTANAGSGKTHVLAQRVINLLLDGVDPAKILCITFTKAAAANMATRVFSQLADWAALDDAKLDAEIAKISRTPTDEKRRARARRLFAAALETPGGLKVQTIHAFCTRLLHQFPFEANVAARFSVLDDNATAQLLGRTILAVLLDASGDTNGPLGRALAQAIVAAADQTFKDVIHEAIGERDALTAWVARAGSVENAIAELSTILGIAPADSIESLEAEYFAHSLLPEAEWPSLIEALSTGSVSDQKHIDALEEARAATGRGRVTAYLRVFCTEKLEPRKNIVTKTLARDFPDIIGRLLDEQKRVCDLLARERAVRARDRTAALVAIAHAVIVRYQQEKERRGLLDYEDLINKTLALFDNVSAAWVLYKLDLGIDHMLIDEAQDTSPDQWEIIKRIVSEFTAGAGARGMMKRTLFAVGDEKQSIFSFQGAAPHTFDDMRRFFQGEYDDETSFITPRLETSFRSGANVLGAVDAVFERPEAHAGLTADPVATVHGSLPDSAPGLVELWPLVTPEKRPEIEGWDAPFDTLTETSPQVRLARKIAKTVKVWKERGLRYGDVLILVRQRGPLFAAIIRALKDAQIDVAGADRLVLTEHIAVMDLLALADALLLPEDELALATVLKSPLFGLDDSHLYDLAWGRKATLRTALRMKAKDNPLFAEANAKLERLNDMARRGSPFDFYAQLLGAEHGRQQILARLGFEANDALDEFLNLALDYERRETPSLQGFIAWLRTAQTDVKRDMEMARDEVRVMTVHGAKGLEAPVVILADTITKPTGPRDPRLVALPGGALAWATAKANDVGPMTAAREAERQAARDEYRRLLYVAMTRAAGRLVVCGYEGLNKRPEGCWYDLVADALKPLSVEEPADDGDGNVWRYRKTPEIEVEAPTPLQSNAAMAMPAWLRQPAPSVEASARTISPSDSDLEDAIASAGNGSGAAKARARGMIVHRLLQSLPQIAHERRDAAARDYVARAAKDFTAAERDEILAQVNAVLDDARFAALFAGGSRAEVPIVGKLDGGEIKVSGQVDRLAIDGNEILIADYKSHAQPPSRWEDAPAYVRQLALYQAVLAKLYPKHRIRAAIVWTSGPSLMEIPAEAMDAAIKGLLADAPKPPPRKNP